MVRLATCFSGIGAIEHALNRMGVDNEIVFACDNGDVDILTKDIALDIAEIEAEFKDLKRIINEIEEDDYKNELKRDLERDSELFDEQKAKLKKVDSQVKDALLKIFEYVTSSDGVNSKRKKEYASFSKSLSTKKGVNESLYILSYAVEVTNDFHKDNSWESIKHNDITYSSKDGIDWNTVYEQLFIVWSMIDDLNGRRLLKSTKDICERLGMLHEKILTLEIHKDLEKLQTYDEKKTYVDQLYKGRESQNQVKKSYLANYKLSERHFHWNVSFLDGNEYKDKVDLFVGGSPCQSFSLVGKQRGLEDTRGTLFYEYARLVKEIRPKVFIYENVRALLSNDDGRTWETIQQVFTSLDYTWSYQILNAKDYGIPQNRERVFVVGFRNDLKLKKPFEFPEPIGLDGKTMKDFLMDNVSGKYYLPTKGVDFVTSDKNLTKRYTQIDGDIALCQKKNQQFNWHGDFVFEEENTDKEKTMQDLEKYFLSEKVRKYVLATGTKGFYSRPETDLDIARPLLTTMHKMHRAGVDNYVTTDGRLRKLTPRECLRLMGFSDSFKIVVSDTSMYQQSGNSIVVDVLMHIMSKILESYPSLETKKKGKKG
ncbi:MAG: DNA cytosine methyltransferase [Lachnospiraceae bacterium]|nr:DNA cytosine methyltransferase [Lachnospiraceae bacterium]